MHDKKYLCEFTRKAYKFLREHRGSIVVRRIGNRGRANGYYIVDRKGKVEIIVDHRRDLLSTLVHELLHAFHGEWSESKVVKTEKTLINQLSSTQIRHLIKEFANAL